MSTFQNPERQREVQRLLGRCMLRLQQYERLMKAVLAHHELAGPVDTLEAERAARVEKLSDKTLGTLVKALFETYAVPEGFERELLPEATTPTDRISMSFSFRITMEPQRLAEVRAAIEELVAMRNELVHHLIERFDVWTLEGCEAAVEYLQACYQRVDRHYEELTTWAHRIDEARATMASFAQSEAFHDLVANGIAPDGSFDWSATGIVRVLRESAQRLSQDGWTSLEAARDWIAASHPDQTPNKYGCRSWPQVLTESQLFDLAYRPDGTGRKQAWYRERNTKGGQQAPRKGPSDLSRPPKPIKGSAP